MEPCGTSGCAYFSIPGTDRCFVHSPEYPKDLLTMPATFSQHRIKCMTCGLHFTVHSDHDTWFDDHPGGGPFCPECGSKLREGGCMHWIAEVTGFIFQHVEGKGAKMLNFIMPKKGAFAKVTLPDEVLKTATDLTEKLDASGDLDKIDKLIKEVEAPDDSQH